jgi:hypothetical protein
MTILANRKQDSLTQVNQEQQNRGRQPGDDTNGDGHYDKKLDGPNRPAD